MLPQVSKNCETSKTSDQRFLTPPLTKAPTVHSCATHHTAPKTCADQLTNAHACDLSTVCEQAADLLLCCAPGQVATEDCGAAAVTASGCSCAVDIQALLLLGSGLHRETQQVTAQEARAAGSAQCQHSIANNVNMLISNCSSSEAVSTL